MLDLKSLDLTQTRFYQEVVALGLEQGLHQGLQTGWREEAATLVLRLLTLKCGQLTPAQVTQVKELEFETLECLGEDY